MSARTSGKTTCSRSAVNLTGRLICKRCNPRVGCEPTNAMHLSVASFALPGTGIMRSAAPEQDAEVRILCCYTRYSDITHFPAATVSPPAVPDGAAYQARTRRMGGLLLWGKHAVVTMVVSCLLRHNPVWKAVDTARVPSSGTWGGCMRYACVVCRKNVVMQQQVANNHAHRGSRG